MSGFLLFVIVWSFLFNPTPGGPYAEVMAKMFGPGPASFAGLGLLVMVLLPGGLSFRGTDRHCMGSTPDYRDVCVYWS